MIVRQAFKFQLRPNKEQENKICRFAGACRYVYNRALAMQKDNYSLGNKFIGYFVMAKELTFWRNTEETAWLSEIASQTLQQKLIDLDRAYKNFFKGQTDFPRFKKKGIGDSFRYPDAKQFKLDEKNNRIFLPKLGWIRYRNSRAIAGKPKNITVSQMCGQWFVSIQTECEVEQPIHKSNTSVGIDVGIKQFATLSDGTIYKPINSFKKQLKQLARCQRDISRKIKFSKNWKKNVKKLSKKHWKVAHVRKDYLHKASTTISKNHAIICIEDLQVKNMSKSASGTIEQPGKNVRQKAGLNRSILDQGWSDFRRFLEYKQSRNGGVVIAVSPINTSRRCSFCRYVSAENRKTQASFKCCACGFAENADLNAARNILAAGHAVLACGDSTVSRSMKQEPFFGASA